MNQTPASVAELQGLYGAFSFSEHLLQKIWLRGDFARDAAATAGGVAVEVLHAGRWNRLGGPDFVGARLRFGGGPEVTGDVELHLHAGDWEAHGHAGDPAYDGVVLHVVLFPPPPARRTLGAGGREIPVLPLLALLLHDLEEFAADEAVERLAARPAGRIFEELGLLPVAETERRLRELAEERWRQKVHFARLRVQRLGWTAACHQTALEILGFRFNRSPMLRLAARFPLESWAAGAVSVESALAAEAPAWSLQGVRPANQPPTRLGQYLRWVQAQPAWPARLAALGPAWPVIAPELPTTVARREFRLGSRRSDLVRELCGGAVGGSRLDTLVADGFLPLLAAQGARENELQGSWFHWFCGDLPPQIPRALRDLGIVGRARQPAANGWGQGLLAWWWRREAGGASSGGPRA